MSGKAKGSLLERIELTGLRIGSPQVAGGVRMVPLLRDKPRTDLRLSRRNYNEALTIVGLDGAKDPGTGLSYMSYVPHGLIVEWTDDGRPVPVYGGQLGKSAGRRSEFSAGSVQFLHRMAKREDKRRLRMLPLHMAMEGFLALYFNGPDIAWREYSRTAFSTGLSPRMETAIPGRVVAGLSEALRLFEINVGQVGVLLFVADALASAFVLPNPDDYRALHRTLIDDFYTDLILHYSQFATEQSLTATIKGANIGSLDDLDVALADLRRDWAQMHEGISDDLIGREVTARRIYKTGRFQLQHFMTDLAAREGNFIGEAIVSDDGMIEYLKTYRLSRQQRSRALLLSVLHGNDWDLERAAAEYGETRGSFVTRMDRNGFGYLLRDSVLEEASRRLGRNRRQ